jgi:hypothetical protein|tara:strand:- start:130 stop:516 length:387 start_codon:yes stop_codon:yes gene_type:complete
MSRPQLGNNRLQLQGFMQNGQAVDMTASAWINEPKERKGDPAARAAIEQIHDILLEHQLTISIAVAAKQGDEPRNFPKIGSWNLFANRRPDQAQSAPPEQQYQAPPAAAPQQQWQPQDSQSNNPNSWR